MSSCLNDTDISRIAYSAKDNNISLGILARITRKINPFDQHRRVSASETCGNTLAYYRFDYSGRNSETGFKFLMAN